MSDKPAGWYRHPDDRRQHAYWDGVRWVEHHELTPDNDASPPEETAAETCEPEPGAGHDASRTGTGSAG